MKELASVSPASDRVRERFELIVNGPALFNAVVAGLELGIFALLAREPGASAERLAEATGLAPPKLRVLLQALCATELVERRDGRYLNSAFANERLTSDGPESWLHTLRGWQRIYYPAFVHTTDALREGTNARALAAFPGTEPTLYQRLAHTPELQATFHAAMAAFTLQSIDGLVEDAEFASVRHLLDVGGNDGTTAARLLPKYPDLRITIFDLPSVTEAAKRAVPEGLRDRVRVCPGDLFADPLPREADAVLFSHVLEIFGEEEIVFLMKKAYDALPSGGRILVYGYHVSDDEQRGLYSARLSLYLNVLASGQGMAYPAKDYERWLRASGCARVTAKLDLPFEHGLLVGWKD